MSVLLDALKKAALEKKKRDGHSVDLLQDAQQHFDSPKEDPRDYIKSAEEEATPEIIEEEYLTLDVDFDISESPDTQTDKHQESTPKSHTEEIQLAQEIKEELTNAVELKVEAKPNTIPHQTIEQSSELADQQQHSIAKENSQPSPAVTPAKENEAKTNTSLEKPTLSGTGPATEAVTSGTDPLKQKLAFSTLLEKNRALEKSNKKKLILSLLMLFLLSAAIIGAYYYYSQMSTSSIIPISEIAKREKIHLNEPSNDHEVIDNSEEIRQIEVAANANLDASISNPPATDISPAAEPKSVKSAIATPPAIADRKPLNTNHKKRLPAAPIKEKPEITISHSQPKPFDKAIEGAYQAFNQGDLPQAEDLYQTALAIEPNHRDALLGNAAVAMAQKRYQDALTFYQKVLERSPKDEFAHGGIVAIASTEKASPELISKVNTLLQEHPESAHLHFLKGALFALQSRWQAAQASFFNAWTREPSRADFAYNLAVALDHIQQPKEALRFYQKALENHATSPLKLDTDAIKKRIAQLEGLNE